MEFLYSTIRSIANSIMLNAVANNSSGLFAGRAGCALALFEASAVLEDKYLEDEAFCLIQEALLTKTNDFSFRNGLSGIAYSLAYLIQNKYVDADINEIFGSQIKEIEHYLSGIILKKSSISLDKLEDLYFIDMMLKSGIIGNWLQTKNVLVNCIDEKMHNMILRNMSPVVSVPRMLIQDYLISYINTSSDRNDFAFKTVINEYKLLYENNFLVENIVCSLFLDPSRLINNVGVLQNLDTHLYIAPLSYQTKVLSLMLSNDMLREQAGSWIENNYVNKNIDRTEKNIISYIYKLNSYTCFENGLPRLLLLLCKYARILNGIGFEHLNKLLLL